MLVQQFLENSAHRNPGQVALIHGARRITYGEMNQQCNRLAQFLDHAGVAPGDRVAVCMDNTSEMVASMFGAWKAGAAVLPLNPSMKGEKLSYVLNNSRAAALLTHDAKLEALGECLGQCAHLRRVLVTGDRHLASPPLTQPVDSLDQILYGTQTPETLPTRCSDSDLALLLYTSGTTGKPKGVMLTHANIHAAAVSITSYLANTAEDVVLDVLPLFFGYGLYQVLMTFFSGGTVVLERSLAFPHVVLQRIAREKVTGLAIVPTVAAILLQLDLAKYDLSSLRYITNAGSALPVEYARKLHSALPHVSLFLMYGQTECIRTSFLPPAEVDQRPDSVGRAMPGCEVYVVNEQGTVVPPGETGELVVCGPNVMAGYWEMPEETAAVLRSGPVPGKKFLYSGDLFRTDAAGNLYFVSRKDDIIKVRGQRVGPAEIEDAICRLPGVVQAAVIGVPDPILGQAVKAFVRVQQGTAMSAADVMAFCAAHLEDFLVPKHVEFCDSLPTNAAGKIDRQELRKRS